MTTLTTKLKNRVKLATLPFPGFDQLSVSLGGENIKKWGQIAPFETLGMMKFSGWPYHSQGLTDWV